MVAVAKARHQPGYGIGLKRGWDRHVASQYNPRAKGNLQDLDTIRRPALPLPVDQSLEVASRTMHFEATNSAFDAVQMRANKNITRRNNYDLPLPFLRRLR